MDMEHGDMSERRKMKMEWRQHAAMRTLAAVIVVVFVFWCGFEFGEIRATVGEMRGGWGMTQGDMMYRTGGMQMHTMIPAGTPTTVAPATGGAASGQQN